MPRFIFILTERNVRVEEEELTRDDVILCQRLCLPLFPLALHDTQLGPSGKQTNFYPPGKKITVP